MLFLGSDEKLIYVTEGNLENTVSGSIVLTDKKVFFYFISNISRDKLFIATHPYLKSVKLKNGLIYSSLVIESAKDSYKIHRIKKGQAEELYKLLDRIIQENR
jgi:hypothetical protein